MDSHRPFLVSDPLYRTEPHNTPLLVPEGLSQVCGFSKPRGSEKILLEANPVSNLEHAQRAWAKSRIERLSPVDHSVDVAEAAEARFPRTGGDLLDDIR